MRPFAGRNFANDRGLKRASRNPSFATDRTWPTIDLRRRFVTPLGRRTTLLTMAPPPTVSPDPELDSFTRNVRTVCGALLGVVVVAGFWLRWGPFSASDTILALLVSVVVCVVGAVRYGDSFWYGFLEIFRYR